MNGGVGDQLTIKGRNFQRLRLADVRRAPPIENSYPPFDAPLPPSPIVLVP